MANPNLSEDTYLPKCAADVLRSGQGHHTRTTLGLRWRADWTTEHRALGDRRADQRPVSEGWMVFIGGANIGTLASPPGPRVGESEATVRAAIELFIAESARDA